MAFLSVLIALLIEQLKPLGRGSAVYRLRQGLADLASRNFDAGQARHGVAAWFIAVLLPSLLTLGVYLTARHYSVLLALAWNVAVLYFTLGFRQFSHYVTDIQDALNHNDAATARSLLRQWKALDTVDMSASDITQQTIEHALVSVQRYVLGVFFWFILPIGPAGAVLYRLSDFVAGKWNSADSEASPALRGFAQKAFDLLDWVPARLTAIGYAIVGNFEDAVDVWRSYAQLWPNRNTGVMLASAAGAVGIRLGATAGAAPLPPTEPGWLQEGDHEPPPGSLPQMPGAAPQPAHLRNVVGLVWRSVLLWMLLLAMLSVVSWVS
ncbi:CobD/CbiB family protein [Thiomonas sp.]|jgi:adenosylcobinamide-phosphate synthase|uniref:CobD/CbiB family protein n=1 Tax=Thiomonas sp. TaxID=2047785 RepID=UPI00260B154A|nr:CobD/CbiB family protein [Thiomonas sp.]